MSTLRPVHLLIGSLMAAQLMAGCAKLAPTAVPTAVGATLSANLPNFDFAAMAGDGGAKTITAEIGEVTLGLIPDGKIPGDVPVYESMGKKQRELFAQSLPKSVDLRKFCEPIRNQGNLGSCTAFSSTALLECYFNQKGEKAPRFSPLYVYYKEREIFEKGQLSRGEKTKAISQDTGASSYLACYTLTHFGAAPETAMPYKDGKEALKVVPSEEAETAARKFRPSTMAQIKTIQGMKKSLAEGHAFILGMRVYDSFMTRVVARTGQMLTLGDREESRGGHSVMCVGYDDEKQTFLIRNSWGTGWGQEGYFEMPYGFIKPNKMYSCFTVL